MVTPANIKTTDLAMVATQLHKNVFTIFGIYIACYYMAVHEVEYVE